MWHSKLNRPFRRFVRLLKKWLGLTAPPVLLPYRGYGNLQKIHVNGHLLCDRLIYEVHLQDNFFKNLRGILNRYSVVAIEGVRIRVRFLEEEQIVVTDANGLFEATFEYATPLSRTGWLPATYETMDPVANSPAPLLATGEVYISGTGKQRGIISDIDDTVLISKATQLLPKLQLMLTKNAKTRLPFSGVAAFYTALVAGSSRQNQQNPIFYVSSSEWNLYDFLVDFFQTQELPKGAFLLQRLKTSLWQLVQSGGGSHNHKQHKVQLLLDLYPNLNFILIGDSGQKDAPLYTAIIHANPGRILAVYIRDVGGKRRRLFVSDLFTQSQGMGVELLLVKDTAAAAQHALVHNFIDAAHFAAVVQEE